MPRSRRARARADSLCVKPQKAPPSPHDVFVRNLQAQSLERLGHRLSVGQRPTTGRDLEFRWFFGVVETGDWARKIESVLEIHGPCALFGIVQIGLETTELRGDNEMQIAACRWGQASERTSRRTFHLQEEDASEEDQDQDERIRRQSRPQDKA